MSSSSTRHVLMTANIVTSVIIPIRNEERYIESCIESLLQQDYPIEQLEFLLVDGNSTDRTCDIVQQYCAQYPQLQLLNNPDKTVPYALNLGIRASKGSYIILMSAHSTYPGDYISKCIEVIERTGADNVGGVIETRSHGLWGTAIAHMLSSKFGVGNARYRVGGAKDGYVDTVPFGTFRREGFDKFGYFDLRLTRNQDYELNYRIRKNGGEIYLSTDIRLTYYSRDSMRSLMKMGFQNGKWSVITSFLCPGSMGVRHLIPLLFVLSLLTLVPASLFFPHMWWTYILLAEVVCYGLLDLGYSLSIAMKNKVKYFLPLILLYLVFHISYGLGSLVGLFSRSIWKTGDKQGRQAKD